MLTFRNWLESEIPDWAVDSRAYDPQSQPWRSDHVSIALKRVKSLTNLSMFCDNFSETHVAIGPCITEIFAFLYDALGRRPEPYRSGWLVTQKEAEWLGFKKNETAVTRSQLLRRLRGA